VTEQIQSVNTSDDSDFSDLPSGWTSSTAWDLEVRNWLQFNASEGYAGVTSTN
jgi:hypothetical protein